MAGIDLTANIPPRFWRSWSQLKRDIAPKELLFLVGEGWIGEIGRTFKRGGRKGERWRPLSEKTIARRRKGPNPGRPDQILRDSDTLLQSFSRGEPKNVYRLTDSLIEVGTNLEYASPHEEGGTSKTGKPMPPRRPMIPTESVASDIAEKNMNAVVRKAARKFNAP